ncbi:MAG: hypothetical protein JXA64_06050 [Candidatus Fermentibacteraceae bacterium]|nr:hypothetical protein [Candidatus Fermentibacteraceae bacterium]MBN2608659.1 hypothetical protein [Candidatus Fermentibacteraceae bacterium]
MRLVLIPLLMFTLLATAEDDPPQPGDQVAIAVQNQFIYPMPAFYASPTQSVTFGTLAVIDEVQGEWYRITTALDRTGWIHMTAVTGAIESSSSGTSASGGVTSDEIMLAGRGFNEDIEQTYAGENPELDFSMVDRMETSWGVTSEELYQFLLAGHLIEGTGTSSSTSATTTTTGGGGR